jgi:hypothetical protein
MFKPEDYVIAVRSYQRPKEFVEKTYAMLSHQTGIDLMNRLFIFVADNEEAKLYADALTGLPFKEIIRGEKGGREIVHCICDSFLPGQPIVFMDDDLEEFFEFTGTPSKETFKNGATNLHQYILDGFRTIEKTGSAFSFSYYRNDFYLQGKPWKEFRPYNLPGSFWGAYNDSKFVKIYTAHLDDIIRTCRYIEEYGGVVVYHWGGFKTATGTNPGGMQSSGDRGDEKHRMFTMAGIAENVYENDSVVRRYCTGPQLVKHTGMTEVKLKSITSIRKLRPYVSRSWSSYFQEHEDVQSSPENTLDLYFE